MVQWDIINGDLIDEATLTLEELARACSVETDWVIERIESGLLADGSPYVSSWRFTSHDLTRARRMYRLERDFEAAPELAALAADLIEENQRLKDRLRAAGV
ncbi:MerR family transcriptional regulator [Halomonas sp. ISL-60]|uniref:chaperone modulator CbpM n=1 Tax=Halomonas sp. ISL-56 TaxID=2819149 RepID=UPI001BECD9C2|nr:chaperone modulator CbpM [Halomonas sp. ISL-56]MBT2774351.1 MerR family transcriptional regulator [Halomonas sp. ISL-60]MBT2799919.1 MerR family transcriptional regulator [Halomonas sp. ISL-56]